MKKQVSLFLLILLLVVVTKSFALNYTISFNGTGVSNSVESVVVHNLTKSTTVTVPAGNVLNLSNFTAVDQLNANNENIRIYNNLADGKSTLSFNAIQTGVTQVNIISIEGKNIAGITTNIQSGINSFQLTLPEGISVIHVKGNGYMYTNKIINQIGSIANPGIKYINADQTMSSNPLKSKSSGGITVMNYDTGDQLLYKGISGNYSTIITDVPTDNKTINFNFVACKDADNNNYTIVNIGGQTWMAANLKATKYRNGEIVTNITDNTLWNNAITGAYCDYNNNVANAVTFGRLYNWYAVTDSRNIAPLGWHVATDAEWTTLQNYLIANGYNYDGTSVGNYVAKSLAVTSDWFSATASGAVGNDLSKNNRSGFSAYPGGYRTDIGSFVNMNFHSFWWTATETSTLNASYRYLHYLSPVLNSYPATKNWGHYVRCVKD